ncbi:carboxylating nicotinate-nucleotide diphosphorylase [Virgibacillus siamensis]|uniref:carboxylating nicotinate-nucleotide diphosphorylase n=1 Tax=Virgibacillus siamensis TaxID=480071 RepID=UPI0009864B68|nr:carboxylating nicotinate-nucleotide diphosphorylase [Virgibacillus siamensis]
MNQIKLKKMLQDFLLEDIGDGDLTSELIFPSEQLGSGMFMVKQTGIISGLDIIPAVYSLLDPQITTQMFCADGNRVTAGSRIAQVKGPMGALLTGERLILNLMQRMSGIATMTRHCADLLDDDTIRICDTRKTVPGLRMLDKYAVITGGGKNHRLGLYDGVMIKDNHIAFCGSITEAIRKVRNHAGHMVKVEVETESADQVREAVSSAADVIMFDNRSPAEVRRLAELVPEHITTEASGGINQDTIRAYKGTGVDYISLGLLTHSAEALDISFQVEA